MDQDERDARIEIDKKLTDSGWVIQDYDSINLTSSLGVIVREYPTSSGPVDYLIFVDERPIGIIEAKRNSRGGDLSEVEWQSSRYANSDYAHFKQRPDIRFVYEATGKIIKFTDRHDIKCRSREIFSFQRPEYLKDLIDAGDWTFRNALKNDMPPVPHDPKRFRECQFKALVNLQQSFADNRPRALIQMATGSGKTYTAITAVYRLLKYAKAKRIMFLVDTINLGRQANEEFHAYKTPDSRLFTELYSTYLVNSPVLPGNHNVYICTIQRMFSVLTGEEINESEEEEPVSFVNPSRTVEYNGSIPPEFFDVIIVDECHRSIYNVWSQVFDYFDSFVVGLTATPDNRTFGFFNQNVVSEYTREQAIIDNVNVGSDTYIIETDISRNGATIKADEVQFRDRLTKVKRWQQIDQDITYAPTDLDKAILNKSTIQAIITEFKDFVLNNLYKDREGEVPKTLIFAKNDTHADDIVDVVRNVFNEGNDFCRKITYRADNPESALNSFRNDYYPRIAVTVNMIATGTDIKPLECLIFMRDVRSNNYFEQMVGRGTRTINYEDLKKVSPHAKTTKTHFVIFDTCYVTRSVKMQTRDLDTKRSVKLEALMMEVGVAGSKDPEVISSLASRIIRLNHTLTDEQQEEVVEIAGKSMRDVSNDLLNAFDEDYIVERVKEIHPEYGEINIDPTHEVYQQTQNELILDAVLPFKKPEFREYVSNVRRNNEQVVDNTNIDFVVHSGWDKEGRNEATRVLDTFAQFIKDHHAEIEALGIFYGLPYTDRSKLLKKVKELRDLMVANYHINIDQVHNAYKINYPDNKLGAKAYLVDLISMVRFELKMDKELESFKSIVDRNFKDWTFKNNQGPVHFTPEQMEWLRLIKDHVASSLSIEVEDFEDPIFTQKGGYGAFKKVFPNAFDILEDLNLSLIVC